MTDPSILSKRNNHMLKYKRLRWLLKSVFLVIVLFILPVGCKVAAYYADSSHQSAWWDLRRDSSRQAPDPSETRDAIIQVYAARATRWKGAFGVHTWIATKESNATHYTRLEVMGYALRWGGDAVRVRSGRPDSYWYGSRPYLLREIRGGAEVDEMIERLHTAASFYRYNDTYNVWPGPNSNTFVAHLARQVPELQLELPATAIGKDFLPGGAVFARPPSGTGVQMSLRGLFGLMFAKEEGVELNLLGLSAGIDFSPLAIKLPGLGRIGFSDFQRTTVN